MVSIHDLKNRKNNQLIDNSIYNQYIQDYKYYFDNTLNKCTYVDKYDTTIKGECVLLDVSNYNQIEGDEKYITTLPDSKIELGTILKLNFAKNETESWFVYDTENLAIPSHKKFKLSPRNFEGFLRTKYDAEQSIDTKIKNNETDLTLKNIYISKKDNIKDGDLIRYVTKDKEVTYIISNVQNFIKIPFGQASECDKTLSWTNNNKEILCPASSSSVSAYQTNVSRSIVTLNELTDLRIQLTFSSNIDEFNNIPNWITIKNLYPSSKFMITQRTDNVKQGTIEINCIKDIFTDSMEVLNHHERVNPDYGFNESYWSIDEGDFKGLLTTLKAEDITKEWGYDVKVTDVLYTPSNNLITESTLIKKDNVIYKIVKIIECKNPDKRLDSYFTIGLVKSEKQDIEWYKRTFLSTENSEKVVTNDNLKIELFG